MISFQLLLSQILTVFYANCSFFQVFFFYFSSFFRFIQPQEPRNLLWILTIGFCIISKCNGMFFKISTTRILLFFCKTVFSVILTFFVIIQVFQPNRKSPLGFINKLLEFIFWPWISFQHLLSQILAVLCNPQFFKFEIFCHFFRFLRPQEPHNLL